MKFELGKNFPKVQIFSSEVTDGSMALKSGDFDQNIEKFMHDNQIKIPYVMPEQKHSNVVTLVDDPSIAENADGVITAKNLAVMVRSADCIPLLFCTKDLSFIGGIHCSRVNLSQGIISKSFKETISERSINPEQIFFFIGPHIRKMNYELKEDAIKTLPDRFKPFLEEINGKSYFDLTQSLMFELEELGVMRENILDSGINTFSDLNFFSFRRDQNSPVKTFVSLIIKNGK